MGTAPESGAVTDTHGSVHGIECLTVADASIMPTVPTGAPNLPIIIVAEHIAQWIGS
jgi:choline dehydrogenase-like flavoprotein